MPPSMSLVTPPPSIDHLQSLRGRQPTARTMSDSGWNGVSCDRTAILSYDDQRSSLSPASRRRASTTASRIRSASLRSLATLTRHIISPKSSDGKLTPLEPPLSHRNTTDFAWIRRSHILKPRSTPSLSSSIAHSTTIPTVPSLPASMLHCETPLPTAVLPPPRQLNTRATLSTLDELDTTDDKSLDGYATPILDLTADWTGLNDVFSHRTATHSQPGTLYDALQGEHSDPNASGMVGPVDRSSQGMNESDPVSDKLGTINVIGMGRTASQERPADNTPVATPSAAMGDLSISPGLKSMDLPHVASANADFPARNGSSGASSLAGRPQGPLKHKDSFGQHAGVPVALDQGILDGVSLDVAEEKALQSPEAAKARGPMPGAFDALWGAGKGSAGVSRTPLHRHPGTSSAEGLAVSASATMGGPVSPFGQASGHSGHPSSSFSAPQIHVEEDGPKGRTTSTADEEVESMLPQTADGRERQDSRRKGNEEQKNIDAIRPATSAKVAAGDNNGNGGVAPPPAAASTSTSAMRSTAGVAAKQSRVATHRPGPQLPSAPNVSPAPPPAMYWSRVPVHGSVPRRSFRAHTANLADEVLWLFGGCDSKGCFRELWCFDTETMCWSKPKVTGDLPPPRRAHTATMVDKRLFVFAGGDGPYYFNDLYVFDTIALRWTKPEVYGQPPSPRRAHTSNIYNGQLIIFGGGNGVGALNDVFSLDITDPGRLEWRKVECKGKIPIGRGYHTSNLVDGKLIVIGGSDGHMSFNDIHILRLDTKVWYQVKTDEIHNRLGHTATQVGSYLFIVGGHDSQSYTPEILTLNLVNLQWEPRRVCGQKPPGRGYHQAWLRDSRLFVHGGFDGHQIYDDLYYIDLAACAYLPQITSFSVELDDE